MLRELSSMCLLQPILHKQSSSNYLRNNTCKKFKLKFIRLTINLASFQSEEFEVASATTVEEAKKILSTGFDYVIEKDGIMLFRRPKRYSIINAEVQ